MSLRFLFFLNEAGSLVRGIDGDGGADLSGPFDRVLAEHFGDGGGFRCVAHSDADIAVVGLVERFFDDAVTASFVQPSSVRWRTCSWESPWVISAS